MRKEALAEEARHASAKCWQASSAVSASVRTAAGAPMLPKAGEADSEHEEVWRSNPPRLMGERLRPTCAEGDQARKAKPGDDLGEERSWPEEGGRSKGDPIAGRA